MVLIPFTVLSPYMSMSRWKDDFLPPNQHRVINPVWLVRATMIRSCLKICPDTAQVYRLSGCWRMGKHRFFAGRPKPGAFPDCIPAAHIRDVVGARWQYWLCECARTRFPLCTQNQFPQSILCVWFISSRPVAKRVPVQPV
jgi:hypothetical protein